MYGYCRLVYCWDCFMWNGDFFIIYINFFNDIGVFDNLLYWSIIGSIYIVMLMCFSIKIGRKYDREGIK